MGDGFSRAILELFGFLGRLSLAGMAGSCVIVLVPVLFFWPKVDRNAGTASLAKITLIILAAIFGGLLLISLLSRFLL